jgi:hypothetical protein
MLDHLLTFLEAWGGHDMSCPYVCEGVVQRVADAAGDGGADAAWRVRSCMKNGQEFNATTSKGLRIHILGHVIQHRRMLQHSRLGS